jgi:hypothetical protein
MLESVRTGRIEPFEAMPEITESRTARWRIPPPLAAVVRKAMALERIERFAPSASSPRTWTLISRASPPAPRTSTPPELFWLFLKRHRPLRSPWWCCSSSAPFSWCSSWPANAARTSAPPSPVRTKAPPIKEDAARRAEQAAHASEAATLIALADSAYTTNNTGQMRERLDGVPAELRNTTWHYLDARADERQASSSSIAILSSSATPPHPSGRASSPPQARQTTRKSSSSTRRPEAC